jgi:hypothetical protein
MRSATRELRSLTCLAHAVDGTRSVAIDVRRSDADMTVTIDVPPA